MYRPKVFVKPMVQSPKVKPKMSSQPRPEGLKQSNSAARLPVQRLARPETQSIMPRRHVTTKQQKYGTLTHRKSEKELNLFKIPAATKVRVLS